MSPRTFWRSCEDGYVQLCNCGLTRLAAASVVALALAGCGSGGSSSSTAAGSDPARADSSKAPSIALPSIDPQDAVTTVEDWIDAYDNSDGATACALQTDIYTKQDLKQSVKQGTIKAGTSCEDGVVAGAALARAFGFELAGSHAKLLTGDDTKANVQVVFKDGSKSTYTLTSQDGKWLILSETDNNGGN